MKTHDQGGRGRQGRYGRGCVDRSSGPKRLGLPAAWELADLLCSGGLHGKEPIDLADVGGKQLEGHQHTLGSDTPDAAALRVVNGLMGPVLDESVHPVNPGPEGGMRSVPLIGLMSEELAVPGTDFRWQGDGALGADLG